jgi:hypothetical protein
MRINWNCKEQMEKLVGSKLWFLAKVFQINIKIIVKSWRWNLFYFKFLIPISFLLHFLTYLARIRIKNVDLLMNKFCNLCLDFSLYQESCFLNKEGNRKLFLVSCHCLSNKIRSLISGIRYQEAESVLNLL